MIAGAQKQFPGHRFELSFGPDAHNDRLRFAWRLFGQEGAAPVAGGVDFATVVGGRPAALGDRLPRAPSRA